jgi:hypothetical protein
MKKSAPAAAMVTVFLIPVAKWSDGTAAAMDAY